MAEQAMGEVTERPPRSPLEQAQLALGAMGRRHTTVMHLFRLATAWLDETTLLTRALEILQDACGAQASSVIMLDRVVGDLYFSAALGPVAEGLDAVRLGRHEGIVGWCMDTGRPVRVNNVQEEEHWHGEISQALGFDVRQLLAAPVRVGGRVIGCLELVNKEGYGPLQFTTEDELLVADAAECLGILFALRGERLNHEHDA